MNYNVSTYLSTKKLENILNSQLELNTKPLRLETLYFNR